MDTPIKIIQGFGEAGIDSNASSGNGQYYVKLYDGTFDMCGYDTEQEAIEELLYMKESANV